jgi:urea carboxylase
MMRGIQQELELAITKYPADAIEAATAIGFPVLIKATGGGGGMGIYKCFNPKEVKDAYPLAVSQGQKSFGNGDVFVEKFIQRAKHIEVQVRSLQQRIQSLDRFCCRSAVKYCYFLLSSFRRLDCFAQVLGDGNGHVVALGERECSVQRRHQKVIEECPSPFADHELRKELLDAAVRLCSAAKYRSAGTVEFLVDADTRKFFFLEARHPFAVQDIATKCIWIFYLSPSQYCS